MSMPYEQRYLANGSTLAENQGRKVSIFVKLIKVESNGLSFVAQTTDNQILNVNLNEPLNGPINGWIEVIGTVTGNNAIRCTEIIQFKDLAHQEEFDTESHNMAVMFWTNCKDIYQSS